MVKPGTFDNESTFEYEEKGFIMNSKKTCVLKIDDKKGFEKQFLKKKCFENFKKGIVKS